MITQGSREHPADLGPFAWIIEVGWATGRVGVVTIKYSPGNNDFRILSVSPPDVLPEVWEQETLLKQNYIDRSILVMPPSEALETITITDEINGVIVYTGFAGSGAMYSGNPAAIAVWLALLAEVEAAQGRPADLVITGGTHLDVYTEHTHPNGHVVTYVSSIQYPVTFTPPDFDWTEWDEYLWFNTTTIEGSEVDVIRKSWFVNFGKNNNDPAAILVGAVSQQTSEPMPYTNIVEFRIYSHGTDFFVKPDGTMEPTNENARVFYEATIEWPSNLIADHEFTKMGFTSELPVGG